MEHASVHCFCLGATQDYQNQYGYKITPYLSDVYGSTHVLTPHLIDEVSKNQLQGRSSCRIAMLLEEQDGDRCLVVFPYPALNTGAEKAWVASEHVSQVPF